jgi:hypothetical protein
MTVNDLVRQAMLNPRFARELVARAPSGKVVGPLWQRRIARALQATLRVMPCSRCSRCSSDAAVAVVVVLAAKAAAL